MLKDVERILAEKGIELQVDREVFPVIVKKSGSGEFGARDLRQTIRREVEDRITDLILEKDDLTKIILKVADDELQAECQ